MRAVGMGTWAHLGRSPDRQCPGDLSKPGQHYTIRTNDDLVSLELRWPETENMTRRLYILLHATTTGLAHSVFKNMVMDGSLSWLKLSREYDAKRGTVRTVAYQRLMNREPSMTREQAGLQLPSLKTNA